MGPARARLVRNALASLAVLGVVALIAFGLPLLDRSLPAGRPVAAGVPYRVGGTVTVVPPAGAALDVAGTRPDDDRGTALFAVDGVRVVLVVGPYHGTLDDAAARLRGKITKTSGFHVTPDRTTRTDQGVEGRRGTYTSPGRVGEYAVFVADDVSVEITASGPEHQLRGLLPRLAQSLRTVTFGGGP